MKASTSICNAGFFLIILIIVNSGLFAQNVTITDDEEYIPHNSAMLDVKSTKKGFLVPRLDSLQRISINEPATGLLVFDTDANAFFYYDGTNWLNLSSRVISPGDLSSNHPIFSVVNSLNDTVFAVYQKAVTIQVGSTETKGNRGGFAVGGLSSGGKVGTANYFHISPDSARIYVDTTTSNKGNRGGFAVGGLSSSGKGEPIKFMDITLKNCFIGHQAGINTNEGLFNSFIGYQSGMTNIAGSYNTFLGYRTGYTNNASYNSFIGFQAGKANSGGLYNSFLGYNAGLSNSSGSSNVFIGYESGRTNTTGGSNVIIGKNSGYTNNGSNNIVIGESAGYSLTTGVHNTFIGSSAGAGQTYVLYNVMIGTSAGANINSTDYAGSFNVFMGINSGYQLASSRDNTLLGSNAGYWIENGQGNTFVGSDAGRGGSDRTPPWVAGTNQANYNVSMGFKSSEKIQTGLNNVVIGAYAGNSNIDGDNNVFLGYQAGYSETGSNKLYIENSYANSDNALIYGEFDTNILKLNADVGIGTNPSSKLDVNGDIELSVTNYIYFGDPSTKETIRMYSEEGQLKAQKYDGTDWNTSTIQILTSF